MSDPVEPGLLVRLPEPPRKVAVLRASRIGDFLCATPAFRALRAALPDSEIAILTLPMLRDLAERLTSVDRVVPFPGFPGIAEQLFDPLRTTAFFAEMQAEHFDLAIQMQGSGVYSNPFTLLLGARATAGFIRPGEGPGLLDAALPLPTSGHDVQHALALTTFLGAPSCGEWTECPLWPEDACTANALLAGCEPPLIGLHPGANAATRRWPPARFAAVANRLLRQHGGTVVVVGDASYRALADDLARAVAGPCLTLAGCTSLPVLAAVIARFSLLVTNDSGPAHIAYALGTPTVTVFGGANPSAYGPPSVWDSSPGPFRVLAHPVPCRPSGPETCPRCDVGYACLRGVTIEQVVAAAEDLLAPAGLWLRHPDSPWVQKQSSGYILD